ncbi:endonuclease-reverse transcriptase [Plakobranchus ocellatus]|uniref:Endonuclease-reverse transcriptase n=1 Tax=Plakobranchus ocellatus TaxID=259542 RepID=A0AAV4BEM6_9GAST|nr:endonuclease-reverse transcriptase [Plakobranchus ocellatus]
MQGTLNGGRSRGRQKKRWEDNIREWTGLELRNTLRKAEDREDSCGCLLSPTLFNIFLERIMTDALEDHFRTVSIGGRPITNLRFSDDIDKLAGNECELASLVE